MHEIKSPFLILMEEQSYLAQSLESAFEKQDVKVKIVTIAEASSIVISEKPSGYLICTSLKLLKNAVSVKVMMDQAIIFLTEKNDAETVKNVMSLKPDGYLLKSMNPQKLHAAIDDFFASRGK